MKSSKRLPFQKVRQGKPSVKAILRYTLLFCSASLLLMSCAGRDKRGTSIDAQLQPQLLQDFEQMVKRDKACPATMVADVTITYSSPIQKKALSGYLQFSLPENYKFAVTNPLGQVFWAVAGDRKRYQTIDTKERLITSGALQPLILRNQLPLFLAQNDWGDWLMARNQTDSSRIVDIRRDLDNRGVWFTIKTPSLHGFYEHLLIDIEQQSLLRRILSDRDNEALASITYEEIPERIDAGQCIQPGRITITGLDYGSSIKLELSAVEFQPDTKKYRLPQPPQYLQKNLP